jgi:hypothetical protein
LSAVDELARNEFDRPMKDRGFRPRHTTWNRAADECRGSNCSTRRPAGWTSFMERQVYRNLEALDGGTAIVIAHA